MEKHVPDLERCKRMSDIGINFDGAHYYWCDHENAFYLETVDYQCPVSTGVNYPAPLVSEMLEGITTEHLEYYFADVLYPEPKELPRDHTEVIEVMLEILSDPNKVSDLLIWLKENNKL